jgi:hypothetical protein
MNNEMDVAKRDVIAVQAMTMLEKTAARAQEVAKSFEMRLDSILRDQPEPDNKPDKGEPLQRWPSYFHNLRDANNALNGALNSLESILDRCEL